ncbi:hypothetical protein U0035_02680 [Niabella yanshanensis]|uniref:Uncharacterized protein n=1 Tax=Niabella yanshanensis TaxID=577386 RepID=A0ABZ0W724_9BACT|nr:hypothetical protein [Niabella yanshanensis]WQD39052.1 hypothetical protein U0035_02680 [Niabella yanshanensis]
MSTKIFASSELMSNYMQGEIIAPDKEFVSIQSENGNSLLFSIGSDGVFYLTEETANSGTGWQRSNLSNGLSRYFEEGSSIVAKTFAVDQNTIDGSFSVVVAVNAAGADYLFIASAHARNDDSSISLEWTQLPFDVKGSENTGITISGVYILQTEKEPLIVVNVIPPGKNTVERYYIDSTKSVSGFLWNLYTLPFNLDPDEIRICGGRKTGEQHVGGIYCLGSISGVPSLYYQQIFNPYDLDLAGETTQLSIPDAQAQCIASTPSAVIKDNKHTYTDLYVSSHKGDLYLFTADNQEEKSLGLKLMTNDLFVSAINLYAYTTKNQVVVWGLNKSHEVFYTECDITKVTDPAAWSYPVPIMSGVEQIAPYKNRVNGGNTYFMHTGTGALKKAVQDPLSTSWTTQDILLPLDAQSKAQKCDCYMTRITVCDEQGVPVSGAKLRISSAYRVPVYINGLYGVLDTAPVKVTADAQGAVKLVQRVADLQGARLWVQSEDGAVNVVVNPMNNAMAKAATLNSGAALLNAQVTDDKGQPVKPLISVGMTVEELDSAAASIQSLVNAYNNYNTGPVDAARKVSDGVGRPGFAFSPSAKMYTLAVRPSGYQMKVVETVGDTLADIGNAIVVAAGDLCNWLLNATEYVIQIIEDTAEKLWHFVTTIGGKVYTFVIDTVEKAIAALEAVFNALKTKITELIQFLKFIFSWDDIKRTNDLYVNVIKVSLNFGVEKIWDMKGVINDGIAGVIANINSAAGITPSADATFMNQPLTYQQADTDYSDSYKAANTFLQDHFINNIAYGQFTGIIKNIAEVAEDILVPLVDALKKEGKVFKIAAEAINHQLLSNDQYKTMSVGDILKVLLAVLADTVLASAANVVDALIDIIVEIFNDCITLLTSPIWIPVVSDILYAIWDYEIEWSLLDIICLIGSVPATLIYKIDKDAAPFTEDDGYSTQLIEAKSMEDLIKAFGTGSSPVDYSKEFYSIITLPQTFKETLFISGHIISGTASLIKGPLILIEDASELPSVPVITGAKNVCDLVATAGFFVVGQLAKPYPIANESMSTLSTGLAVCAFANKIIFMAAKKVAGKSQAVKWGLEEIKAAVDLILSLTSVVPVAYHYSELGDVAFNQFRKMAIMDDTAKLTGYISNIAGDIAKFDPDPLTSTVVAISSSVLSLMNGSLQYAESFSID